MGSTFLNDYIENAKGLAAELIPEVVTERSNRKSINTLTFALLQHGTCNLLLHGKTEPLSQRTMQGAGAFAHYLSYVDDGLKVTSDSRPFFGAIGSGYWDGAEAISKLSRTTWNPNFEYEEDFLFILFLMKHFFLGAPDDECRGILDRHEEATEGEDKAHRDVCAAFLDLDERLFDDALRQLLTDRKDKVEDMVRRDAIPEEHWSWLRYFSFEGWALLKLAERKGMKTEQTYLHVPKQVRPVSPFVFDPNAWRGFEFTPSQRRK